jgi:hypothetical protein
MNSAWNLLLTIIFDTTVLGGKWEMKTFLVCYLHCSLKIYVFVTYGTKYLMKYNAKIMYPCIHDYF